MKKAYTIATPARDFLKKACTKATSARAVVALAFAVKPLAFTKMAAGPRKAGKRESNGLGVEGRVLCFFSLDSLIPAGDSKKVAFFVGCPSLFRWLPFPKGAEDSFAENKTSLEQVYKSLEIAAPA